jgi:hypothetical protein
VTVHNFVGGITIQPGPDDTIRVTATKWADSEANLDFIEVRIIEDPCNLSILTTNPSQLNDLAVDLDLIVPEDIRVLLYTGVGGIEYEGRGLGTNSFETGVGSIKLWLPAGVNVEVDLGVGVGGINVDFDVQGQVSNQRIVGVIGSGADGDIQGYTGVGSIHLTRQQ